MSRAGAGAAVPPQQPKDDSVWSNETNLEFYNAMAVRSKLPEFAKTAGLDQHDDLRYVEGCGFFTKRVRRSAVLEVGSGYGRCLSWLNDSGFKNITGVDYSPHFVKVLKGQFAKDPAVKIKQQNIKDFNESFVKKFSLILWLWCGFCDFQQVEQVAVLRLLMSYLNDNGLLIVDVPIDTNATSSAGSEHSIARLPSGEEVPRYTGYVPNFDEIAGYAKVVRLRVLIEPYTTYTGRERCFGIFFYSQRAEIPLTPRLRKAVCDRSKEEYEANRRRGAQGGNSVAVAPESAATAAGPIYG